MTVSMYAPAPAGMRYDAYVDPKSPSPPSAFRLPDGSSIPRVDESLVRPETREEIVRGRRVHAAPALEPHADRHHAVDFLTGGCVAPGFVGSSDLLTRARADSQFATDTCIRREGIDPATESRYLEELAFEIVNEQSLRDITERAEDLSARGVRRIIAIFVKRNEVREWSAERNDWVVLEPSAVIDDRTLVEPIPVRALLERAVATRAVVQALYAKKDPAIIEIEERSRNEGRNEGRDEGRAQMSRTAIVALCDVLGIALSSERRSLLQTLDADRLEQLHGEIHRTRRWA